MIGKHLPTRRRVFSGLLLLVLACLLLVACGKKQNPKPTSTMISTLTPSLPPTTSATLAPSPTPTATPTPTPIPPIYLTAEAPKPISALSPAPIEVWLAHPAGVNANVRLRARVIDGQGQLYAAFDTFTLQEVLPGAPLEQQRYVAQEQLQLPLQPAPGVWHLIIDIQADLPVRGYRDRVFTPDQVACRDLSSELPAGVALRIPWAFSRYDSQGGLVAGSQTWRYRQGELSLFWTPGPAEKFFYDNALVMWEATWPANYEITLAAEQEALWGTNEYVAFIFQEQWTGDSMGGPAETLVIQGPDHWLYALRIRGLGVAEIPALLRDVRDTFDFVETE